MNYTEKFNLLQKYYDNNEFEKLLNDELGLYFLKLRSLSRVNILRELAEKLHLDISNTGRNLFKFIFSQNIQNKVINEFIKEIYKKERAVRKEKEDYLYNELFKLKVFDWGGFYQNAVEKTIINNYVKKIDNYDELCDNIENEINPKLRNYILCSWYNNWSSILIEDMFKDHPNVLPSIGLVKKIDFFINDFPFDLKVTYFPDGFMKLKRSEIGLGEELTELKRFARANDIYFDNTSRKNELFTTLLTKISEDTRENSRQFIKHFHKIRRDIIDNTIKNPSELIKWFYEEQGERRFDAANRFFLVLIDLNNLEESWKLKRNKIILHRDITNFLDKTKITNFQDFKLNFTWENQTYTTYSIILFVIK